MPTLLYPIFIGGISAYLAKKQGRNPIPWFCIGAFSPICSLLLLFALPIAGYFLKKKLLKPMKRGKPQDKDSGTVTIDIPPFPGLQVPKEATKKLWYFLDKDNQTMGPMSFALLYQKWKEGQVFATIMVILYQNNHYK